MDCRRVGSGRPRRTWRSGEAHVETLAAIGGPLYGRIAGRAVDPAAFSEELGGVLSGITVIVFGAAILGVFWLQIELAGVIYAALSLTIVRMLPVAVAMVGSRARTDLLFLGWFGRRGLAYVVFGAVIVEASGLPHTSALVVALTVIVVLSVFAHGITAAPLAQRYAAWHTTAGSPMEIAPVPEQRWRHRLPRTP